jgi:galactokinase
MQLQPIITEYHSHLSKDYSIYFSPGRINLIGEHIDYLGGRVFPTAITLGTYAIVSKRTDDRFVFISHNFKHLDPIIVPKTDLAYQKERGWTNYPVGMIDAFVAKGLDIDHGLTVIIYGTLPNGAGLSSSASLEVLMGIVLEDQYDFPMERVELVQLAQHVENNYVGVNCGIMDQFAVGMSKEHHAIYLDTNTLDYQLVPLRLGEHSIVIANTNVKRGLVDSKYNERREECDTGLAVVQKTYPNVQALCETTMEQVAHISFPSKRIAQRVRHAITENNRTKEAVDALEHGNLIRFGSILNEGHKSIKEDFEVSCYELDVLQESFITHGAIGARMTGAGFGGCVIAIVPNAIVDTIMEQVKTEYARKTKYTATCYVSQTSDGARRLTKEEWQ